jgi:hypothetical protein
MAWLLRSRELAFHHFSCDFARRDFGIAADQIGVDTANQLNKKAVRCERAPGTYLIGANCDPIKNASHSNEIITIFLIVSIEERLWPGCGGSFL